MTNALARLEPKDLTELKGVAQLFAESGMFKDSKSMAQAFVKIMAGREIGIGAFAAMQSIYIVDNKPTYSSNAMAAAVKRSGKYDYHVIELKPDVCEIHFFQTGELIGVSRLTIAEAKAAGMHQSWDRDNNKMKDKQTWKSFPANMLFARAMSNGVRWYCPDVFDMPVYTPEEMGAEVDEDERVIDGNYTAVITDDGEVVSEQPAPQKPVVQPEPEPEPPAVVEPSKTPDLDKALGTKEETRKLRGNTTAFLEWVRDTFNIDNDPHAYNIVKGALKIGGWADVPADWLFVDCQRLVTEERAAKHPQPAPATDGKLIPDEQPADASGKCACGAVTSKRDLFGNYVCDDCAKKKLDAGRKTPDELKQAS